MPRMFQESDLAPGIPNEIFPSDHLAIGCDLRWLL